MTFSFGTSYVSFVHCKIAYLHRLLKCKMVRSHIHTGCVLWATGLSSLFLADKRPAIGVTYLMQK